jgi:hypothetical protein
LKECLVVLVAWEGHTLPWLRVISLIVPKPPLVERSIKTVDLINAEVDDSSFISFSFLSFHRKFHLSLSIFLAVPIVTVIVQLCF